jgi:hypothetical protein
MTNEQTMQQIDDECFAAAEGLVASVFSGASHRERIALVLEIATPIFGAVKVAMAKQGKKVGGSVIEAPAKRRHRRTKAEIAAASVTAAPVAAPQRPATPPAPQRPATPPAPIPPPSGLAPSPFGAPPQAAVS